MEAERENILNFTGLLQVPPLRVPHLTEADLWNAFRAGNLAAFDYIFESYIRLLYSYGHKLTRNAAMVEDCIQDLFVELWEKRQKISATNSIKYYLFKSLRRKLTRAMEMENKLLGHTEVGADYHFDTTFSYEAQLIASQITEEQTKNLTAALALLSKRQKEVIYLRYYNNLPYDNIASIMGLSLNSTYKMVSKAINTLKQQLKAPVTALALLLLVF